MPTVTDAWSLCGRGDFRGAADLSRQLLAVSPLDGSALACLAVSLWQLGGDAGQAISELRRAAELAPEDSSIPHNLATLLASIGELDEARRSYLAAIALKPDDTQAFYALTQSGRFTEETDLVRQMRALYAGGELSQRQQEYVCFGLAKVFSDLGRHRQAMHFCIEGNWVARRPYDAETPRADLAELRQMVASRAFKRLRPAASSRGPRPIFVVGMPRSGTTLVETILSRHPNVFAGGEMSHIGEVETALLAWTRDELGYKGGVNGMLEQIPRDYFSRNAEAVLGRVRALARGRPFAAFTDKLPENTQRLGLISLLFPEARIIYLRRHPLDCCISNLFLHFQRGSGYAFSQTLLGERYRQVAETMALWKSALRLPILDVSYEALVRDPEPSIQRIVAFAGLDWNEACLTPHMAERSIGTANQWQVRQPINTDSVGRWRHYEAWIEPLIAALGGLEAIQRDEQELARLAA
jgi:tetratricopeptide (TPR) repeat protein